MNSSACKRPPSGCPGTDGGLCHQAVSIISGIEVGKSLIADEDAAASDKFDRVGSDAEKYEGMPTVRLITSDMI